MKRPGIRTPTPAGGQAVGKAASGARGRGATINPAPVRTGSPDRAVDGDWLDERGDVDGDVPPLRTHVVAERPRTIISYNQSPDIGFDRSINPYRGCEHGCVYCYARPTHAFHDLSPGLDFETRLFAKPDAARLLRAELARPSYVPQPVALGSNTDPFQPIERDWGLTRQIIQVLAEARHPVTVTTKSDRVLDVIDLLAPMAGDGLVSVAMSVTTLDPRTARTLEPRAAAPHRRLAAVRALADAGVPVQVNLSPIIPWITDHEIEAIVAAAADAGAAYASYIIIRLPLEVAPLMRDWLRVHHPDRAARVMRTINDMRGGRDNDPRFGHRMAGMGIYAAQIRQRFKLATRRHGVDTRPAMLRTDLFRRPAPGGQLDLF